MINKLTVIIPVFNAEKYIDKCLETILGQTLTEIEVLLINDGSTDNSLEILNRYEKSDNRIKVFTKKNGGQSSARNIGLDNATGEYISFIDIDDYIAYDMLEMLYNNAIETNSQISICGMGINSNDQIVFPSTPTNRVVFDKITAIKKTLAEEYILFSVCDKIYKSSLFDGVRFPIGVIHEDVLLPYQLVKKSTNVCCEMKPKYFYNQNDNSTMTKKFSTARLNDITAREEIVSDIILNFPELYKNSIPTKLVGYLNIIHKLILDNDINNNDILKKLVDTVKKDRKLYLTSSYVSSKRKIGVFLIWVNFSLYKLLYRKGK